MDRRRFLQAVGASATVGVAGCVGGEGSEGGGRSIDEHPAAAGLDAQPRQGPLDGHVVLAFEDPSCERCRAFHENVVPDIRSNLVEPGRGAYVLRNYPVVFPWGEPASKALEATFARDSDAFWSLLDHYFTTQDEFTTETVADRTASFLDSETDLDGAAIVEEAESGAYDDAVQTDVRAAEDAGLGQTTPVILLFEDGQFVTKANGSVSYDLIAEALGV